MLLRRSPSACPLPVRRERPVVVRLGVSVVTMTALASAVLVGCGASESASESTTVVSDGTGARASVVVYRTLSCGCCKSYEDYLSKHEYAIRSEVRDDLGPIRAEHDVPPDAASCHTVLIDGYAVEGHVPVEAIEKLLAERPAIDGIGIPGMPTNAPGMGEPDGRPIDVLAFDGGQVQPFMTL